MRNSGENDVMRRFLLLPISFHALRGYASEPGTSSLDVILKVDEKSLSCTVRLGAVD